MFTLNKQAGHLKVGHGNRIYSCSKITSDYKLTKALFSDEIKYFTYNFYRMKNCSKVKLYEDQRD